MNIECIPAFEDNYIWLIPMGEKRVAAVDPGDAAPVLAALRKNGWELGAILTTHHHRDHTGGIAALVAQFPVPVYGPGNETIPGRTHAVREGEEIALGEVRLRVVETPGHTRGHLCYVGEGALFCGDTLFLGGCGRLFEGTAAQMYASLEKLRALPDDTLVYCAHEYTRSCLQFARTVEPESGAIAARIAEVEMLRQRGQSTVPAPLAIEKRTNPFLRSHEPPVVAAAEVFTGHRLDTGSEVFAAVRRWKDSLD